MRLLRFFVTLFSLFLIIFTVTNHQATLCFVENGQRQYGIHIHQFPCSIISFDHKGLLAEEGSGSPNCHDFIFRLAVFSDLTANLPPATFESVYPFLSNLQTISIQTKEPSHRLVSVSLDFTNRDLLSIHSAECRMLKTNHFFQAN